MWREADESQSREIIRKQPDLPQKTEVPSSLVVEVLVYLTGQLDGTT
jgi:hypothetical protein